MSRIELNDGMMEIIEKMSDGNPGAITFLMELMTSGEHSDVMLILILDTLEIYGSRAYMVWNDICGRDLETVRLLFLNISYGKIKDVDIIANLNQGRANPYVLLTQEELEAERSF